MAWRMLRAAGLGLATLALLFGGLWGAGALWYQAPGPSPLRFALAAVFLIAMLVAIAGLFRRRWRYGLAIDVLAIAALLVWWTTIRPSNDRVWAAEMARSATYERAGDAIKVANVRNFEWTSLTAATERWETRSYDLSRIAGIDVLSLYWMGPAIGHTYFSFVFEDGEALSFSVEIRKEMGEPYSPIAGFFKGYELAVVAGDERDLIGWRTFAVGEDVQMFRTDATPQEAGALLLALLDKANALAAEPEFYNTITANCTTAVWELTAALGAGLPLDMRVILSGYLPDYLYDLGRLDGSQPLSELRRKGELMPRAKAAMATGLSGRAFSAALRQGVPRPNRPDSIP